MFVHESSYRGFHPFSFFHRTRLRRVVETMRSLRLPHRAAIADFGCSNAFFFAELLRELPEARSMHLFGFDHSTDLLAAAKVRNIDNAVFDYVDLNQPPRTGGERFDVVTCFETLEHVGSVTNAIESLARSCKPGGTILISVPNELGLPGLLKYGARKFFRKKPYETFFRERSELRYVWHLLTGQSISVFREGVEVTGWGPHLGFDWRVVLDHLNESRFVRVLRVDSLILRLGYILVVRRL